MEGVFQVGLSYVLLLDFVERKRARVYINITPSPWDIYSSGLLFIWDYACGMYAFSGS